MTVDYAWKIHAAYVDCVAQGATPVTLHQITEYPIESNIDIEAPEHSGEIYPACVMLRGAMPQASLACTNIAAAFNAFGHAMAIATDGDNTGLHLYAKRRSFAGGIDGTSVHKSFNLVAGAVYPRRLTADVNGATIFYDILALQPEGVATEPIIITDGAALPVISNSEAHFRLGKVTVAGQALRGVERVTVEWGYDYDQLKTDADYYPSYSGINFQASKIQIEGINADWWKSESGLFDQSGTPCTHANTSIQLRKKACGGKFVADATAEHVVVTAAGVVVPQRGLMGRNASAALEISCRYDGANAPLTVDTSSIYTP